MFIPDEPIVGQTAPTIPTRPELTPEQAIEIAIASLTRERRRRISRLRGINKLRALGGGI
jgi:hypothetical protein